MLNLLRDREIISREQHYENKTESKHDPMLVTVSRIRTRRLRCWSFAAISRTLEISHHAVKNGYNASFFLLACSTAYLQYYHSVPTQNVSHLEFEHR